MKYFYEKRYYRSDGEVYTKRYSRSFPLGKLTNTYTEPVGTNVSEASASRAKSRVRLLAFSNPDLEGLLTLTFRGIPTEEEASIAFANFRKKVSRSYKGFKFLGVRELQKRGSIHYHLLVNFCPGQSVSPNNPRKWISTLWQYGFSDYSPIVGDDKWQTELYLLKYLGKENQKLFKAHYVRSRNLLEIEPRHFDTKEPLHPLAKNIFATNISNNFVANFQILEYTYSTTLNKGKYGTSKPTTQRRSRQE